MNLNPLNRGMVLAGCCLMAALSLGRAGLPAKALQGDSFALVPGHRQAGSNLIGQLCEKGGEMWSGSGQPILTADGSVTVADEEAAMGLLPLAKPDSAFVLSADLQPAGAGFAALVLLPNDSPGDFWTTAAVWVLLHPNGDYEVYRQGTATLMKKGAGTEYAFKAGEYTQVDLFCDPAKKTVAVRLNGTVVLPAVTVPDLPPLVCAAFRFNEKSAPKTAKIANFAISPAPVGSEYGH